MSSTITMTSSTTLWVSDHPPQTSEVTNTGQIETNDRYVFTDNSTIWQLWYCRDASDQLNLQWVLITSVNL